MNTTTPPPIHYVFLLVLVVSCFSSSFLLSTSAAEGIVDAQEKDVGGSHHDGREELQWQVVAGKREGAKRGREVDIGGLIEVFVAPNGGGERKTKNENARSGGWCGARDSPCPSIKDSVASLLFFSSSSSPYPHINGTLYLLPGTHILNSNIPFPNVTSLTIAGINNDVHLRVVGCPTMPTIFSFTPIPSSALYNNNIIGGGNSSSGSNNNNNNSNSDSENDSENGDEEDGDDSGVGYATLPSQVTLQNLIFSREEPPSTCEKYAITVVDSSVTSFTMKSTHLTGVLSQWSTDKKQHQLLIHSTIGFIHMKDCTMRYVQINHAGAIFLNNITMIEGHLQDDVSGGSGGQGNATVVNSLIKNTALHFVGRVTYIYNTVFVDLGLAVTNADMIIEMCNFTNEGGGEAVNAIGPHADLNSENFTLQVLHSTFAGLKGVAITADSYNLVVQNCSFLNLHDNAIQLKSVTQTYVYYSNILGSIFDTSEKTAITSSCTYNCSLFVFHSTFRLVPQAITVVNRGSLRIESSLFINNTNYVGKKDGTVVFNGQSLFISSSVFRGNFPIHTYVPSTNDVTILHTLYDPIPQTALPSTSSSTSSTSTTSSTTSPTTSSTSTPDGEIIVSNPPTLEIALIPCTKDLNLTKYISGNITLTNNAGITSIKTPSENLTCTNSTVISTTSLSIVPPTSGNTVWGNRIVVFGVGVPVIFFALLVISLYVYWRAKTSSQIISQQQQRLRQPPPHGAVELDVVVDSPTLLLLDNASVNPLPEITDVRIGKMIGKGNFGTVYAGSWRGAKVALKTIPDENLDEIRQEASVLLSLQHPNIVRFFGLYANNNNNNNNNSPNTTKKASKGGGGVGAISSGGGVERFMVTEFVSGGSLEDTLTKNPDKFSFKDLLRFACDAAAGMMLLEEKGILHRDLAIRNLLIDTSRQEMRVKVSDFGMARVTSSYVASKGSPVPIKWSAPEVLKFHTFSSKSDVWSMGIVIWEIISLAQVPYMGMSNKEARDWVLAGNRLALPAATPPTLVSLVMKCWEEDPNQRPSFGDILKGLASVLNMDILPEMDPIATQLRTRKFASKSLHNNRRLSHSDQQVLPSPLSQRPLAKSQPMIFTSNHPRSTSPHNFTPGSRANTSLPITGNILSNLLSLANINRPNRYDNTALMSSSDSSGDTASQQDDVESEVNYRDSAYLLSDNDDDDEDNDNDNANNNTTPTTGYFNNSSITTYEFPGTPCAGGDYDSVDASSPTITATSINDSLNRLVSNGEYDSSMNMNAEVHRADLNKDNAYDSLATPPSLVDNYNTTDLNSNNAYGSLTAPAPLDRYDTTDLNRNLNPFIDNNNTNNYESDHSAHDIPTPSPLNDNDDDTDFNNETDHSATTDDSPSNSGTPIANYNNLSINTLFPSRTTSLIANNLINSLFPSPTINNNTKPNNISNTSNNPTSPGFLNFNNTNTNTLFPSLVPNALFPSLTTPDTLFANQPNRNNNNTLFPSPTVNNNTTTPLIDNNIHSLFPSPTKPNTNNTPTTPCPLIDNNVRSLFSSHTVPGNLNINTSFPSPISNNNAKLQKINTLFSSLTPATPDSLRDNFTNLRSNTYDSIFASTPDDDPPDLNDDDDTDDSPSLSDNSDPTNCNNISTTNYDTNL